MIIDAHVHVGRHLGPSLLGHLSAGARRLGVSTLLVSALGRHGFMEYPTIDDLVASNEQAAEAVAADPVFAGLVHCSGDHPRESVDLIRRYVRDGPFVGVKLWIAQGYRPWLRADLQSGGRARSAGAAARMVEDGGSVPARVNAGGPCGGSATTPGHDVPDGAPLRLR